MDMYLSKLQEMSEDRGDWCATVHEVTKNQTRLSDWTTTNNRNTILYYQNILPSFLAGILCHFYFLRTQVFLKKYF